MEHKSDEHAALLQKRIAAVKEHLAPLLQDNSTVASQTFAAYFEILDEAILDVAQGVHREAKRGPNNTCLFEPPSKQQRTSVAAPVPLPPQPGAKGPVDVFGQSHPAKATEVVTCKNCGRQVQAGTFAPHLEKCMGKGRAAARAASRRIQNQG